MRATAFPPWLANLWLALRAATDGDKLSELAVSASSVHRWLDSNMVKGNADNIRLVRSAIRAYFAEYDWRLLDPSGHPAGGPVDLIWGAAKRLRNVYEAALCQ